VKSVREQGVMRTFGDAVDAAGVGTGLGGRKIAAPSLSTPSGSYADLCATRNVSQSGSFSVADIPPYTPAFSTAKTPQIQPFVQQYQKKGFATSPGAFNPAGLRHTPFPSFGTNVTVPQSTMFSSVPSASSGTKDPPLKQTDAIARFEELKRRESDLKCFDCGGSGTEWVSVSFGVYLCITCGGYHRQMGTHISRIRSITMDSWTERQLELFQHGGNSRLKAFFEANGVPTGAQQYGSQAAEWYREAWIKCRTMGRPVPPPPAGVVAGPCVETRAPEAHSALAKPPADLLDFSSEPAVAESNRTASMTPCDLLEVEGPAAATAQSPDLLDFSGLPSGGDLLDFGDTVATGAPSSASDLLGLNEPASTLDITSFDVFSGSRDQQGRPDTGARPVHPDSIMALDMLGM